MEMLDFRQMPYERPDMEAMKACYADTIEKLNHAASYAEAREAFFALQEQEKLNGTMMSLCSVRNTIDTTDAYYEGEMKWLREQNAALIPCARAISKPWRPAPSGRNLKRNLAPKC